MTALPADADMVLALPIKGESFLLRRAGHTVLVDGGYKRDGIAGMLAKHVPDVKRLDIVLCTHGDRDHVGGLPALLDAWAGRIGQLWLPGRWVDVVPRLARDPEGFLHDLIRELDGELREPSEQIVGITSREGDEEGVRADRQDDRIPGQSDEFEDYDDWGDDVNRLPNPEEVPREPAWFDALRGASEELVDEEEASRAFEAARRRVRRRYKQQDEPTNGRIALYWLDLIETARAIRGVAIAAIHRRVPTRWFDFEGFAISRRAVGGIRGFLVPINAVEQVPPPTSLALYMRLTKMNQQSLVFFAPPRCDRFGVLFCGDSPLGDGTHFSQSFLPRFPHHKVPWHQPIVVTAPHHGSETNRVAYDYLTTWAESMVLLRAGGSHNQPGQTFLNQRDCLRLCAKCPRAGHAPMLSGIVGPNLYHWNWWGSIMFVLGCGPINRLASSACS